MTILEQKIDNFIIAIEESLKHKNYFAALTIALTLPDICSKLENPNLSTGERYRGWFDKYLLNNYQRKLGPNKEMHTFLSGDDCYALRCSFLHQGEVDISTQRSRKSLTNFIFIEPQKDGIKHMNQFKDTLQLQVDIFCEDVVKAVREWLQVHKGDASINERSKGIIEIRATIASF